MERINNFFSKLKRDLDSVSYLKALSVIGKQAKRYTESFNNPDYSITLRRYVNKQYKSFMKLLEKVRKRLMK